MIKRVCLALVVASVAVPAYAANCHPFDKSKLPRGAKFSQLTVGQTHFAQGAFTAIPPIGPPSGDGAMLIQIESGAAVAFTSGKLVCQIMPVTPGFLQVLLQVGTGPLEKAAPPHSHDGDLKI